MESRPTKSEELFLSLGYNRFYDLYNEVLDERFWEQEDWYRFSRISNIFSVYAELLTYKPFESVFEVIGQRRPPMQSEIGEPFFKFIRNVIAHFPIFETWNDIWLSKELVNWQREGLTIDRFLKKYAGHEELKYRFWEADKELMTYVSIRFPNEYGAEKIYLRELISEREGVTFSLIMMKQILNTQVESVGENA